MSHNKMIENEKKVNSFLCNVAGINFDVDWGNAITNANGNRLVVQNGYEFVMAGNGIVVWAPNDNGGKTVTTYQFPIIGYDEEGYVLTVVGTAFLFRVPGYGNSHTEWNTNRTPVAEGKPSKQFPNHLLHLTV